jgi:HAD superfamily hydrolase (TIGR01509 family)
MCVAVPATRDSPAQEATLNARLPAAVLFDMDGTLVDSEKVWDVALTELALHAGGELSAAARQAMIGSSMARSMQVLHDDLGQPWRDAAADAAWLTERVHELFGGGLTWRPGARELLAVVRGAGLPTALVTSTGRRLVEVALQTLGRQSFDVVVCGDEVTAAKPDPAPYRMAAELLGVAIEDCVAIEDSPTGVASARACGAAVLAVPCELDLPPLAGVVQRDSLIGVDMPFLASLITTVRA